MMYAHGVLPILREQRTFLLERWGGAGTTSQKSKDVLDIVTATDIAVEQRVSAALARAYPAIGFVGEERGGDRGADRFWLMDPIDGTLQFAAGERGCTSMIALIEQGVVTFSAIYDFLADDMYFAQRGHGAYCNDTKISVSTRTSLKGARFFWEMDLEKKYNRRLFDCLGRVVKLTTWTTAGFELALVASGAFDGRVCVDPYGRDYDFAAGSLLVCEAGGVVANIGVSSFDYRDLDFIATNKELYRELTEGTDPLFPLREHSIT